MIAWKEGKPIQKRHISGVGGAMEWHDVVGEDPYFGCEHTEWRVKLEPREWWLVAPPEPATAPWHVWTCKPCSMTRCEIVHVREVLT